MYQDEVKSQIHRSGEENGNVSASLKTPMSGLHHYKCTKSGTIKTLTEKLQAEGP